MFAAFSSARTDVPQPDRSVDFRLWTIGTVLALATIALYWPILHHGFVDYDDNVYVRSNAPVQGGVTLENIKWAFSHVVCGNWHPLTMISHMLDCQIYGLNAAGHHFTSIFFHALDTVLLFVLLRKLTSATWRSVIVAALFACHPLHVESVAWIAERKDVLSTFFGFLSLLYYVQHARDRKTGTDVDTTRVSSSRTNWLWLAWLSLALGLMSKPMLVTWPFVMLLLDCWPLDRFRTFAWKNLVVEKIPGFILIAAGCAITYAAQSTSGATYAMKGLPLTLRCENALVSYVRYLEKLFWPEHLAVFYPHPGHLPIYSVVFAGIFLCAVSVFAWLSRKRLPYVFLGWFWFLGTLVPVIGIMQVGVQAMADRYMYIPSVGLFVAIVWGSYEISKTWPRQCIALSCFAAAVIVACCVITRQQLQCWQNSETLFKHDLSVVDDNIVARANLAVYLRDQNRIDEAITNFQAAAQLQPDYVEARNDLANLLAHQGRTDEAVRQLQDVIRRKPQYADAHCSLARIYLNEHRSDDARAEFQEAMRLAPDSTDAHYGIGHLLAASGQTDAALGHLLEAERLNSKVAAIYFEAGNLLVQKNKPDEAITQFRTATQLDTNYADAYNNLGKLLAVKGQLDDAVTQFQEAVRAGPNNFEAHNNLGNILAMKGQADAAAARFQEAIRLKPDYADAHFNYGNLLASAGQTAAAIAQFREAIRLSPNDAEEHYRLGNLLVKDGQTDAAIQEFKEAIRIKPNYTEAARILARVMRIKSEQPGH